MAGKGGGLSTILRPGLKCGGLEYIVYHILESRETILTSQVSLVSTLCTQGLFYPCCRCSLRCSPYVEDSSGGHRRILVSFPLDAYFFISRFNYRTLNFGIVINNF